jgi:hypothetical protein
MDAKLDVIRSLSQRLREAKPLTESFFHPLHIEGSEEYFIDVDTYQQNILKKMVVGNGVQHFIDFLPFQTGLSEPKETVPLMDDLGLGIVMRLIDERLADSNLYSDQGDINSELSPRSHNSFGVSFAERYEANLKKLDFAVDHTNGPVIDVSLDEKDEALLGTTAKFTSSFFPKSK